MCGRLLSIHGLLFGLAALGPLALMAIRALGRSRSTASEYALETGLTFGGMGSPAVPLWTEKPLCCEVLFMGALFG